jgi:cutinase
MNFKINWRGFRLGCAAALGGVIGFTAVGLATGQLPEADGSPCTGSWSIVMGGLNGGGWQDSAYMHGNARVGYNSHDPRHGVDQLNGLFWEHRNSCPSDHIKLVGHSEGGALVHTWATENPGHENVNIVALADPKRPAGPGGPGIASHPFSGVFPGFPLAGVDNFYGGYPFLSVCNWDDPVCNVDAGVPGWISYLDPNGTHGRYAMDANAYGDWDNGVWMK